MKKIFTISILNILLIVFILFLSEILIYKHQAKIYYNNHPKDYVLNEYTYEIFYPEYITSLRTYYNGQNNLYFGRKPDGTEYKGKTPITIFGCSYAFGQHMNYNQTLSFKLAHKLKRPVYNRSISGGSFQHMYTQVNDNTFWEDVPASDTVIYVMIDDHYRRTMLNYFDILDKHVLLHYSIKNGKLVKDDYSNKISNFINSLYTVKAINHIYANKYIYNKRNADKITDNALLFFTETKKELQNRWKKDFKFAVILYEYIPIPYRELLIKKLSENGFIVFSTNELTKEDLKSEKYMMQDNHHPNEAAWDLLVPKIVEKLELE